MNASVRRLAPLAHWRVSLRTIAVIGALAPVAACEWFTDFKRQPKIDPWERLDSAGVRGNPQTSVPITGSAVPGFVVSYANLPATIDSMSTLRNPTPPNEASLQNGRKYYTINCAVCHGLLGKGDGLAVKYGVFPFPLVGDRGRGLSDGYIFGMIRNGRGNMPPYNRIEEKDRWDVVNYVRGLQGVLPTGGVPTGPLGVPGFNGAAVPGATELGPTRPVPHTAAEMDRYRGGRDTTASRDTTGRAATDSARAPARGAPRPGERE
jgi:mono/diheme cytochrome c family protein